RSAAKGFRTARRPRRDARVSGASGHELRDDGASGSGNDRAFGPPFLTPEQSHAHVDLVFEGFLRKTGNEAETVASHRPSSYRLFLGAAPDLARTLLQDIPDRQKMDAGLNTPIREDEEIPQSDTAVHDFLRSFLAAEMIGEQPKDRRRRENRR